MSKVLNVSSENFQEEIVNSEVPVLVDFWAPWCQPCLIMAPILDDLSEEMEGRLKVCKINIEEPGNQKLAVDYQIQNIPNMKLLKKGKVSGDFIGTRPKAVFKEELEKKI